VREERKKKNCKNSRRMWKGRKFGKEEMVKGKCS